MVAVASMGTSTTPSPVGRLVPDGTRDCAGG